MPSTSLWERADRARGACFALLVVTSVAFVVGLLLPVVELRRGFAGHEYSVLTGIADLGAEGNVLLAVVVLSFSVLFPIAKLAGLFVLLFRRIPDERRRRFLERLSVLGRWSMLDVFVVVILIGAVRLGVLSNGEPRPGIYVFAIAILMSMLSTMGVQALAFATLEPQAVEEDPEERKRGGWLAASSLACFVAGLALPLMHVEKWFFWGNEYSVLGATGRLLEEGEVFLGLSTIVFVVLLPVARLLGVVALSLGLLTSRAEGVVQLLDKWSMLDVFGLALLVVMVKIGDLASVELRYGFWFLLAAVVLSLVDSWWLHRRRT